MIRLNLIESRAKRVKRFIRMLTDATRKTGVVIDVDCGYCGDTWISARAVDDLGVDVGDQRFGLHWNGKTKHWEDT